MRRIGERKLEEYESESECYSGKKKKSKGLLKSVQLRNMLHDVDCREREKDKENELYWAEQLSIPAATECNTQKVLRGSKRKQEDEPEPEAKRQRLDKQKDALESEAKKADFGQIA